MHRLLRVKSSYISLTYAIPSENFIVSFSQWKFDFSDFIMLCSTFYIRRGWVGRLSENNITCAWNQWNKLPRKTNSKLSGHMTETMWVQCFQVPKIFCVLASPNLAFIFLIGPFLLHIFCTFCSKNAKIRQKRQTMSQKMYFPATHEGFVQNINPWLCMEKVCGPGEWKAKCIVKEHNSQTGQTLKRLFLIPSQVC